VSLNLKGRSAFEGSASLLKEPNNSPHGIQLRVRRLVRRPRLVALRPRHRRRALALRESRSSLLWGLFVWARAEHRVRPKVKVIVVVMVARRLTQQLGRGRVHGGGDGVVGAPAMAELRHRRVRQQQLQRQPLVAHRRRLRRLLRLAGAPSQRLLLSRRNTHTHTHKPPAVSLLTTL